MADEARGKNYISFCHRLSQRLTLDRPLEVIGVDIPLTQVCGDTLDIEPIWEVTDKDRTDEVVELRRVARWYQDYLLYFLVDHFFSEFPEVCDISARFTTDYFGRLYSKKFKVYEVTREYKGAYHCWTLMVSKMTGEMYYVDFTRLQFMSKYMREEIFIKPNKEIGTYQGFRWLAGLILAHKKVTLPCPVMILSKLDSDYNPYNPIAYYMIDQQRPIGRPFFRRW